MFNSNRVRKPRAPCPHPLSVGTEFIIRLAFARPGSFVHPTVAAHERHQFPALSRRGADHRRDPRPRHFLCGGENPGGRPASRHRVDLRHGASVGWFIVVAGGIGVSAIILASAQLFAALKFAGALYLVWLGIRTVSRGGPPAARRRRAIAGAKRAFRKASRSRRSIQRPRRSSSRSFRNSWIRPRPIRRSQFMALGLISVALNTLGRCRRGAGRLSHARAIRARPDLFRRLRQGSGLFIAGLGVSLALGAAARRKPSSARPHAPTMRVIELGSSARRAALRRVSHRSQNRSRRTPTSAPATRHRLARSADSTSPIAG